MIGINAEGYALVRPLFGGSLTQKQVDGITRLLNACHDGEITMFEHVAYLLATVYHETAKAMHPVEESERSRRGRRYNQQVKRSGLTYAYPKKVYYGRGDVQLTWYENYKWLGQLIGVDLLTHPEKMLEPDTSAKVAVIGMKKGCFTGVKLDTYFNETRIDPVNARKIINGNDCDELIAKYYHVFLKALEVSNND